jgi:uracil-DNA glycosylase
MLIRTPERLAGPALLRWYVEMGADEAIGAAPVDRLNPTPRPAPVPVTLPRAAPSLPIMADLPAAVAASTPPPDLAALEAAVRAFDGCGLRRTATNTVFADGIPGAPLMIVGEAPGADEDRIGLPFVGRSGQLLDRMLAAIGFSRQTNVYITNVLFWRPPGNRKPTTEEIASCLPFVRSHIALARPKILLLTGGTAAATLLGRTEGIMRLRGRWCDLALPGLDRPVPTMASYHPSFLLRTPGRKNEAWRDLLAIESKMREAE